MTEEKSCFIIRTDRFLSRVAGMSGGGSVQEAAYMEFTAGEVKG